MHTAVQVRAEHDVAYIVELHNTDQDTVIVGDGEQVAVALRNHIHHVLEAHVGVDNREIPLDDAVHLEQREHRAVLLVGEQLTALGKAARVDAVRGEDAANAVTAGRHDEQRQEQFISTGHLGRQEDGHHGCMHHSGHHTGHAHEGKILDAQRHFGVDKAQIVEQVGKEYARHASHKQRGSERSAHASAAVGGCRSQHLEGSQGEQEQQNGHRVAAVGIEEAVVEDTRHVTIDQAGDALVTLAIQWRHQVDEQAQREAAHGKAHPAVAQPLEATLQPVDEMDEIERHKTAKDTQQHDKRDAGGVERLALREKELDIIAREHIGHRSAGHRGGNQRNSGTGGEVEHEYLDGEQHARNRGLEDARDTCSGAASHKHGQRLWPQPEGLSQIAADGGTGEHDRTLGTDRTTKTDGQRRRNERRVHVVDFQPAFFQCQGI